MNRNNQILIITDSLGFPRQSPEALEYNETYVYKLKREFKNFDIVHFGIGGGTIKNLYDQTTYYYENLNPRFVFVQSGIVDCAPRALTMIEQQVINRLPLFKKNVLKLIKNNSTWLRRKRRITYTSIEEFTKYIKMFNQSFNSLYWIGIAPSSEAYENIVPGITENILSYNKVVLNHLGIDYFISLSNLTKNDLMTDFHHLNDEGHKKVYELIKNIICDKT